MSVASFISGPRANLPEHPRHWDHYHSSVRSPIVRESSRSLLPRAAVRLAIGELCDPANTSIHFAQWICWVECRTARARLRGLAIRQTLYAACPIPDNETHSPLRGRWACFVVALFPVARQRQ